MPEIARGLERILRVIENGIENDPRVQILEKELREYFDFDAVVKWLAICLVESDDDKEAIHLLSNTTEKITSWGIEQSNKYRSDKVAASKRGKMAANAFHDRPGSSREKQEKIRVLWASGKYSSRDICAEQECAALNMSFATARKALRNTPYPPSRCAA